MSFLRHIGKHGERKVAVVFREVPGEPHMALVTYTQLLNQHIHDPMMQCIESDIGQNSENLADALNRSYTKDGKPILPLLHREGQLKKVQTESIIMTPAPNTTIKLSELNSLLNEMKQGEDAIKKLAELDNSRGLQDPADIARRMREKQNTTSTPAVNNDPMSDTSLAKQRLAQSLKMEREAKGLMAESKRLLQEARELDPTVVPATAEVTMEKPTELQVTVAPAKKAGRPKKSAVESVAQTTQIAPVVKTKTSKKVINVT